MQRLRHLSVALAQALAMGSTPVPSVTQQPLRAPVPKSPGKQHPRSNFGQLQQERSVSRTRRVATTFSKRFRGSNRGR